MRNPLEWGRRSTCSDPVQAPRAQLQAGSGAQQPLHILLWHWNSLPSAPRSPPNGSVQAAEKPRIGQSTVMVPRGTCICLPLPLCAAGRRHSRAHAYPACAWHGKSIWPNHQFESSSLPLETAKTWYVALTIRTWLSLVFQEQNLCAVKRDFFYFSTGRPLFQLCLWAAMADHPKRSRNSAHPHSSKGPGIRGVNDNHPSRSCRLCSLLSLPLPCCAAAACTRTHHPSRCSQCTDTDTAGECVKHMEATSNLIKTSTHREAQAHPIPQEKHLK